MIIGAYPNSFESVESNCSSIQLLQKNLSLVSPQNISLHLLPFFLSEGDWGFAQASWFKVDPVYGTEKDIRSLAKNRPLFVDGIYNHVASGHPIVSDFFKNPESNQNILYAYCKTLSPPCPLSPRGGPVLLPHKINGSKWWIWHTFNKHAYDINLDNPSIRKIVLSQIEYFKEIGVSGVRLDGPTYFGKILEDIPTHRHHKNAYRIARELADEIYMNDMQVISQIDVDRFGVEYFKKEDGYPIPGVDYAFSAHILNMFMHVDGLTFCNHINSSKRFSVQPIRAPRTHDGILLRSKNLSKPVKQKLVETSIEWGVPLRIIDDDPYEFNCSLPYLLSRVAGSKQNLRDLINCIVVITVFCPGLPYIYLPFLLGYIAENDYEEYPIDDDPRSLNRMPITHQFYKHMTNNGSIKHIKKLLTKLSELYEKLSTTEAYNCFQSIDEKTIVIDRNEGHYRLIANITNEPTNVAALIDERNVMFNSVEQGAGLIGPFGYIVCYSH